MKPYDNIPLADKIALLNMADNSFHAKIMNLKGKSRIDYIEKEFNNIDDKELLIQIYNDECLEEDYNLNLNDIQ